MTAYTWQPIETAPKDRRIALGYTSDIFTDVRTVFGHWDEDKYARVPRPYWTHDMVRIRGTKSVRLQQPAYWMDIVQPV